MQIYTEEKHLEVMNVSMALTAMLVPKEFSHVQTHQIVCFKFMLFLCTHEPSIELLKIKLKLKDKESLPEHIQLLWS